jgi:hypothetical protein
MNHSIKKLRFNKALLKPLDDQQLQQLLGGGATLSRAVSFSADGFGQPMAANINQMVADDTSMAAVVIPYKPAIKV